jgi:hypothetical protein
VLDTSDVPAGVVNIVTGEANVLARTLAEHDGVDALWYVGDTDGAVQVEAAFRWQPQGDLDLHRGDQLGPGRGPPLPPPRDPGQKHLDTVGRVAGYQTFITV